MLAKGPFEITEKIRGLLKERTFKTSLLFQLK